MIIIIKNIAKSSWSIIKMEIAKRREDEQMYVNAMGSFWQQFNQFEEEALWIPFST